MNCRICNSNDIACVGSLEGYKAGSHFTILECRTCESSAADPCASDPLLYDAIYRNVSHVPGYARYHTLAEELLDSHDPLAHIENTEDCYYAIVTTLANRLSNKEATRICEVGCGQGYLTYALSRGGFNCTGIDISAKAVALATERFGHNYYHGTIAQFITERGKPDVIIASELIEHLEDPVGFIADMLAAVGDGGFVVVTTPNKLQQSNAIWDTELPPVHLWWFTQRSLTNISETLDCEVDFVDFTNFYRNNTRFAKTQPEARLPIFDEQYELIGANETLGRLGAIKQKIKRKLPRPIVARMQRLLGGRGLMVVDNSRSGALGAIYSKRN